MRRLIWNNTKTDCCAFNFWPRRYYLSTDCSWELALDYCMNTFQWKKALHTILSLCAFSFEDARSILLFGKTWKSLVFQLRQGQGGDSYFYISIRFTSDNSPNGQLFLLLRFLGGTWIWWREIIISRKLISISWRDSNCTWEVVCNINLILQIFIWTIILKQGVWRKPR